MGGTGVAVMSKIFSVLVLLVLAYGLPLLGRHDMLRSPPLLIGATGMLVLLMSQSRLAKQDVLGKLSAERCSVWFILAAGVVSSVAPIVEWRMRGFPAAATILGPTQLMGATLMAGGLALRIHSMRLLSPFFTPTVKIQPARLLVTRGPYRFVRHPSYLGALAAVLGHGMVLSSSVGSALGLAAMMGAFAYRIEIEERVMLATFGARYADYRARTRALVPFLL